MTSEQLQAAKANPEEAKRLLSEKGVAVASAPDAAIIQSAELLNSLKRKNSVCPGLRRRDSRYCRICLRFFQDFAEPSRPQPRRARRRGGLMIASSVAILTTVGIVLSVLFESVDFFKHVSIIDFLTGTVWDPRFADAGSSGDTEGQFGLVPLMWGTLYISFVALLVAVAGRVAGGDLHVRICASKSQGDAEAAA